MLPVAAAAVTASSNVSKYKSRHSLGTAQSLTRASSKVISKIMNAFRVAVLIASLIVVNGKDFFFKKNRILPILLRNFTLGEAQESEDREVTSLNSLQNSQAPAYNALPAQSYGSPYGYQQPQYGGYGYQQPQMYQPQPPMPWYPQSQPQYPNYGGNMNYGYGAQPVGGAMYQPPVSVSQPYIVRLFR